MSKPVATKDDVKTQAGTLFYGTANQGSWSAGTPTVTSYAKLKIGGKEAVYEASCEFSFTGALVSGPSTTPVNGSETVTLKASDVGPTKLQKNENQVLRDGDSSDATSGKSSYGNVVSISSSQKLKSG